MKDKKVLVTGGAGFIGSRLVSTLLTAGALVTVIDNFSTGSRLLLKGVSNLYEIDLPDGRVNDIVASGSFDIIFHLAGPAYVPPSIDNPIGNLLNTTEVTLEILEAVRRRSPGTAIIYTSSAAVYGSPETLPINESSSCVPVSPYGVSKYAAETYVSLYSRLHGLRTASLRLFSVFGPGQRKQVIFDFLTKLKANPGEFSVHGTGDEVRDFIYVDDVVNAAVTVALRGELQGEVYNVASGEGASISELVNIVIEVTGTRPQVLYTGKVRPGDALKWVADVSKLKSLGFEQTIGLREGVKLIANWFNQNDVDPLFR